MPNDNSVYRKPKYEKQEEREARGRLKWKGKYVYQWLIHVDV